MRKDNLAGLYYQSAPTLINKQLEAAFKHEQGPGETPGKTTKKQDVKGIIVPKYAYDQAGPCAAWAYKALIESKKPDVYILFSQVKGNKTYITNEPFETPYGIVRVDQKINLQIQKSEDIEVNDAAFDDEPHIRSQLPMLQFVTKRDESIKILPVKVGTGVNLKKLSTDLKEAFLDQDKTYQVIMPTNLTRFGRDHSYIPFGENQQEKVRRLDKGMIEAIKTGEAAKVLAYYEKNSMNTENIIALLLTMLFLKPKKVLLEQYYLSSQFKNDPKNFISFASLILK